jgi:chromosome segregation ATPase
LTKDRTISDQRRQLAGISETHSVERENYQQQLLDATAKLESLLRDSNSTKNAQTQKLQDKANRVDDLEQEVSRLKEQMTVENRLSSLSQTSTVNEAKEVEIARLITDLEIIRFAHDDLKNSHTKLEDEHVKIVTEFNASVNSNNILKEAINELQVSSKQSQTNLEQAESKNQELELKVTTLEASKKELESLNESAYSKLAAAVSDVPQAQTGQTLPPSHI